MFHDLCASFQVHWLVLTGLDRSVVYLLIAITHYPLTRLKLRIHLPSQFKDGNYLVQVVCGMNSLNYYNPYRSI